MLKLRPLPATQSAQPERMPWCHDPRSFAVPIWEQHDNSTNTYPTNAMHIGFFETRKKVNLATIMDVVDNIHAVETSSAPIIAHLLFFRDPGNVTRAGIEVTVLDSVQELGRKGNALASCLYSYFRRTTRGPGGEYVWKPLMHLLLSPSIENIIMLDVRL